MHLIANLPQGWSLFSEEEAMNSVKNVAYSYNKASTLWLLASTTGSTIAWIQELYNWASTPGPTRIWHTLLLLSQLSLPNPFHFPLNYYNSTSILSHSKYLQSQVKCRSSGAGCTKNLLSAHKGEFIRRILLYTSFEGKAWIKMSEINIVSRLFFFSPHHFYVFLGNDNNCHFLTQTTYLLVASKGKNSKGTNYGCKCFSQEQFCGIRTCVYIIGDI